MNKILFISMALMSSSIVLADISLECKTSGRTVTLDVTNDFLLRDSQGLNRSYMTVNPNVETNDRVEFLIDFGSDYEKLSYKFSGLKKCGIYGDDVQVATLATSIRSFYGNERNVQLLRCSCIED